MEGSVVNELCVYSFSSNKWMITPHDETGPCPRGGHAACVYKDRMYVFGGRDEESKKLNDIWELNLLMFSWAEISCGDSAPSIRMGHSAALFGPNILIFGGI